MFQIYFLTLLLVTFTYAEAHLKDGTDIFFKTNIKEIADYPLTFDNPLPNWLKGTLIRNGLGRFEVGSRRFTHALDAYAKLSSWKFPGNGSAFFSTRMVYSESYKEAVKLNDIAPYLILGGTNPPFERVEEIESFINGLDNMDVNIIKLHDSKANVDNFTIVSDYWNSYEFDPITLRTIGPVKPKIPDAAIGSLITLGSAHPLPEFGTKNHLALVNLPTLVPEMKSSLNLVRIKSAMERELIAKIEVDAVPYMHSFPVSKNYAIIFAHPYYVDVIKDIETFRPLEGFRWVDTDPTKLYVINLKTGKVQDFKTDAMFLLHVVNAFESTENDLYFDATIYKNPDELKIFEMATIMNLTARAKFVKSNLKRFHLDLSSGTTDVKDCPLSSSVPFANNLDFPTINENFRFGNYCFAYGLVYNVDDSDFMHVALVKKDLCTGKGDRKLYSPNVYLNEAFFVPRPGGWEEDDGVLILPVLDVSLMQTNITIVNARDLVVLNTAPLPINVPFGTHGKFFADLV